MPPKQHLEGRRIARNGETLQELRVCGPTWILGCNTVEMLEDSAKRPSGHGFSPSNVLYLTL